MKNSLKYVYLLLSILTLIYICVCLFFLSFSISVALYFFAGAFLFFALYYVEINKIDSKEEEPNPIHVFIKVASIIFFGMSLLMVLFNIFYPKNMLKKGEKIDYIIVFGAGINGKNEIINGRLENAIKYADMYDKCRFVLTGAKGIDEPIEEAYYMKEYMIKRGIKDIRVLAEPFSVNTCENITNSLELVKIDIQNRNARDHIIKRPFYNKKGIFDLDFLNIGFMSSDFHMTRIVMMAKKQGIKRPYVVPCNTRLLYLPYMYIRENLSLFKAIILNQVAL